MRRLLAPATALVLAGCAHLPPPGVHMRALQLPVTSFTAPSGLHVVIEEDPSAQVAGVVAVVGTGSAEDPVGKEGLAHLVEHLAFRSRPDGKTSLDDLLNYAGAGDVNAETGLDTTTYYAFGPKESLQSLINLVGAQVAAPLAHIDDATFETEREVVRNEMRERTGHGDYDEVVGWMQHALFPAGHAYAHTFGAGDASLAKLTLADAQSFVKAHYLASNMTLVIAGNVTPEQVGALMDRVLPQSLHDYAPHADAPKAVAEDPPAPPPHPLYRYQGPVQDPTLYLVWSMPPAFGDNDALETYLEHSFDSRLGYAFFKDDDIASVSAHLIRGAKASLMYCEVKLLKGEHPEKTADYVLNQAFLVAGSSGFSRLRTLTSMSVLADLENIETRAITRAETLQLTQDPGVINRIYGQLAMASASKLTDFAYKYLSRDRARLLLVTPEAGSTHTTAAAPAQEPPSEESARVKYDLAAIARIAHSPGVSSYRFFVLPNGLKVAIGQRPFWPQVSVALSLEGGEHDGNPVGAGVMAALASQDPDSFSHGYPEQYGTFFADGSDEQSTGVFSIAGGGNVANVLAMLSDRLGSLRLPSYVRDDDGAKRYVGLVAHQWEHPESAARRTLAHALYGESGLGHLLTQEELSKVSASDVGDWLDRTYDPKHAALVIVGDVDPVATEALVRDWMSRWNSEGKSWTPTLTALPTAAKPRVLVTPKQTGQTRITLACAASSSGTKDEVAYRLLAQVLAQDLDSSVRKTLGASYGFHPRVDAMRGGVAQMSVSGEVDPARLAQVLRELHHRWALLPLALNETELNRARWALARSYSVQYLSDMDLATATADALRRGESLSAIDDFPSVLNGLTRAELQKAAATCAKDSAISVVGDPTLADTALTGTWK